MSEFDLSDLQKPFLPEQLEWRIQRSGLKDGRPWAQVLVYVTARAVFDRLDAVVGPNNWKNTEPRPVYGMKTLYSGKKYDWKEKQDVPSYSYDQSDLKEVVAYATQENCLLGFNMGIAIRIGDEWVERWDGADVTDVEPYKGGISSAWKRAGVPWGIGRYLYGFDQSWADFDSASAKKSKMSASIQGQWFNWLPPLIPDCHLPEGYDGDQYAHLMKGGAPAKSTRPKKKAAASKEAVKSAEPLTVAPKSDNTTFQTIMKGLSDLAQKGMMVDEKSDIDPILARLSKAREHVGKQFASAKLDQTEMNQLTMFIKSIEDDLNAKVDN